MENPSSLQEGRKQKDIGHTDFAQCLVEINRGPKHRKYKLSYRTICLKHHKEECIICKENLMVDVHHWDNNHKNDDPSNLIPLCATHHRYTQHNEYYYYVKECIDDYHKDFIDNGGVA